MATEKIMAEGTGPGSESSGAQLPGGPEGGAKSPMEALNAQDRQVVRQALINQLPSEKREELNKRYSPDQIDADIDSRLANLPPERAKEIINQSLEADRRRKAEAQKEVPESPPETSVSTPDRTAGAAGDGGGRPPEGPRPPEMGDKEWETSPERGRAIVKEIIRLETTMPYAERYRVKRGLLSTIGKPELYKENGIYLDQLYEDLQDYTRALRRVRNIRDINDPWNPINAYKKIKEAKEALERIARGESPSVAQQPGIGQIRERGERPPVLPTESLNALFEKYTKNNIDAVEGDLATYFQEARALGLLDRADAIFTSTYRQITQGNIPADQIEEVLERNTELARRAIDGALRARRTDAAAASLQRIAEAYTTRTADVFQLILTGEAYAPIEGEFRFDAGELDDEDTRLYWEPGHYPKMYEITAQNKNQFRRAMYSFISKITKGAFGKSPDELYEHFNNFTEKFTQTASSKGMEDGFVEESRLELQGHGFVFGGDYSFETYNMKSANQFLMAMALHEGPQRWVRLARSGNGAVGAYLRKFDYDPRVNLMHNPGGSRGQLLHDTVTQHYLHAQIRDILIEEGVGVVLKDYDPRDADSAAFLDHSIKVTNVGDAEAKREEFLKANLERIGIHQTVEEFKGLYEGLDTGDAHIVNYERYKEKDEKELKQLSPRLRKSVIIGKVQVMLRGLKIEGRDREQLLKKIDDLVEQKRLTDKDKRIWLDAYDQSKANFDVAFQMVGATGEKARRGGGVFFIDRKDEQGHRFVDNMPVYLGEMFVQYAENRAKIQFANFSAVDRTVAVVQARALANQQIKSNGFEARLTVPKLLFNTDENSPKFGDVIGLDGNQTETIDFDTATDPENPLNKWLNHTYLSYQPENRHQITNPDVLKAAKRLRMRLLTSDQKNLPGQEDNLASIALVLDPTLNRIASLKDTDMPEGMSAQQAEILFSEAAVEASNMGHWRIVRELNAAFMPSDGNMFKFRTGYNLEDYSGIARFIIRMRQFVASNPKRFARRYAAEIANLPLNVSSMPDQWGQVGVLGAIEMFADPVGIMSEQREASQFAITKWVDQMRIGNMIFGALVGQVDSEKGFSIEGFFEKPTNNAEMIARIQKNLVTLNQNAKDAGKGVQNAESMKGDMAAEEEFMKIAMETFDRLWIILKLVRTMESDTRNAQGALDLEAKDILKDGKPDAEILEKLAKDDKTGSSRHTEKQFFYAYIKWLTEGEGAKSYAFENAWYIKLNDKTILDKKGTETRADWLFRKMTR